MMGWDDAFARWDAMGWDGMGGDGTGWCIHMLGWDGRSDVWGGCVDEGFGWVMLMSRVCVCVCVYVCVCLCVCVCEAVLLH